MSPARPEAALGHLRRTLESVAARQTITAKTPIALTWEDGMAISRWIKTLEADAAVGDVGRHLNVVRKTSGGGRA